MADPYEILGVADDADDGVIRKRYLELVRQFPPEQHPQKFAAIRAAYEQMKDLDTRLAHRLFEAGRNETIQGLIEDIACRSTRRRLSLPTLLTLAAPR
jgi:curved DNA-binding protein CbpA